MNSQILQISPTFLSGAQRLHALLSPVTFVCAVAGLLIIACAAMRESHLRGVWTVFVRMAVAVWLLGSLPAVGDLINSAVIGLMPELGWGTFPGGVAQAYRDAIARRWGTQSAASNNNFESGGSNGQSSGTTGSFDSPQTISGVKLTHYGSASDSTGDSNSAAGIGNHNNQLTPFQSPSIPAGAALSQSVASQYNVSLGQSFTATASGTTYNLIYQDTVPATYNGQDLGPRIDIFDPNNLLGPANSFSGDVTALNNGPTEFSPSSILGPDFNPLNPTTWFAAFVNALVFLLSIAALGIMMLATLAQQLLYIIELAISPIFIGLMLIPGLSNLATRFFTSLAALLLWPLGWIVCDLVTRFFLDLLVQQNPSQSLGAAGLTALGGGGLAIVIFLVTAIWVIGSSFVAPVIISALIITGGSGVARVFASTLGVVALTAYSAARNAGVSAATGAIGSAISGPISIQSGSRMNGASQSFARRPQSTSPATNGNGDTA